jgi:hypothetical protein
MFVTSMTAVRRSIRLYEQSRQTFDTRSLRATPHMLMVTGWTGYNREALRVVVRSSGAAPAPVERLLSNGLCVTRRNAWLLVLTAAYRGA